MRRRPPPPFNGADPDPGPVHRFLADVGQRIQRAQDTGHLTGKPMITAGGSAWFDLVVEHLGDLASLLVLRSGCYVTHDHGFHVLPSPLAADQGDPANPDTLRPALTLWAQSSRLRSPDWP